MTIIKRCDSRPHPHICTLFFLFACRTYQQSRQSLRRYIHREICVSEFLCISYSSTIHLWRFQIRIVICLDLFLFSPITDSPGSMTHVTLDVPCIATVFTSTDFDCLFRFTHICIPTYSQMPLYNLDILMDCNI